MNNQNLQSYNNDKNLTELIRALIDDTKKYLINDNELDDPNEIKKFNILKTEFNEYYWDAIKELEKNSTKTSNSSNKMLISLINLMKKKIDTVDKDLIVAKTIQRSLIPAKVPRISGYDIAAYYHPSEHVGGDFYYFYPVKNDRLYFVVADVSGHGVGSSLMVASMQAFIQSQFNEQKSLHSTIENLNNYLVENTITSKYSTLFMGSLELESGNLNYINAGHNPPYIIRENNQIEELKLGGSIIGMFKDVIYTTGNTTLKDNDILAVFTDGVIEAMNHKEEEFSEQRFLDTIIQEKNKPLLGIMLSLFNKLRVFCKDLPYGDDITLLFFKKKPNQK